MLSSSMLNRLSKTDKLAGFRTPFNIPTNCALSFCLYSLVTNTSFTKSLFNYDIRYYTSFLTNTPGKETSNIIYYIVIFPLI